MRLSAIRQRKNFGFGARIGAGFAAVLVVVAIGYAIGFKATASFGDAMELLRRTEEAGAASVRVSAAVQQFEMMRSDSAALEVEAGLEYLLQRLDGLYSVVLENDREADSLQAAQRAAERYRDLFRRLLVLEQSRREHLDGMDDLLTEMDLVLSEAGRVADVIFIAARERVEEVDIARNMAANAANHANAVMVALSGLRQIEAHLLGNTAVDVAGATELAETKFEQLFAAIPSLKLELPQEARTLRKFERWLSAYRKSLLRVGGGSPAVKRTLKTASVLLQTESNNLYRAAALRYTEMQVRARIARAKVNSASDTLSQVNLVQIEVGSLRSHHESLSDNQPHAADRATQVLDRLNARIDIPLKEFGSEHDWRQVLRLIDDYRAELEAVTLEAGDHWDALLQMRRSQETMQNLISAIADRERVRVEAQQRQARDLLLISVVGALLLSIGTAAWITRQLARELGLLSESMHKLAGGNRQVEIPYLQREDQTGNMARALVVFRDNAESLHRYQQSLEQRVAERTKELERARLRAEHLAQVKSEFLANMSHEIRTPLNAVLGLAQVGVRSSSGRGSGRNSGRTFGQILESGHHLLGVINDILDFSKLEAGKMSVLSEPFPLRGTIEETVALMADSARERGIELRVDLADGVPDWARGDALRLRQVLLNLLNNALKFTEKGRVGLSVYRGGDDVLFEVADSGIGMSPVQIMQLFRPFEQADGSTTRKFGGTGLGLAISDNLVKLMGGDIGVTSVQGEGSVFTVRLPLPEAAPVAESQSVCDRDGAEAASNRLPGVRLLVVDDVEINRFIAEELLVPEGALLTTASDGKEALDRVASDGSAAFDAVLMDVQMPHMDGHEATRRILDLAPELPVIGVTAHALADERERCLASGMCDHVTKPIDLELLVDAILRHIPTPVDSAEPETTQRAAESEPESEPSSAPIADGLINWPALSLRFHGKQKMINKLIGMVLRDHASSPHALRESAQGGDWETVAFIAHKLKNVGGTLEAETVFELSPAVELAAKQGDAEAADLTEQLAQLTEKLLAELSLASDLPAAG